MIAGAPVDHHVHIAGLGTSVRRICPEIRQSGIWLNPAYLTWLNPELRFKLGVLMSASGISEREDADAQYVEWILALAHHAKLGGTYYLYALDWRYDRWGAEPNKNATDLYVANEFVLRLAECLNRLAASTARFVPVGSVHPYKVGAIRELHALADAGVRYIKWLPPAQNIDPDDPDLLPYYETLRDLRMVLLSHTGDEHTFRVTDEEQDLGDPVRLGRAVGAGVTVVMFTQRSRGARARTLEGGRQASLVFLQVHPNDGGPS